MSIGAEPEPATCPDDFTLEKTIAIMEDMMEGMNVALEECCAEVRAKMGDDLGTKAGQDAINQLYMRKFPLVNEAVHKKHKCDKSTIEV